MSPGTQQPSPVAGTSQSAETGTAAGISPVALRGRVKTGFASTIALGIAKIGASTLGWVPVFAASKELKALEARLDGLKREIAKQKKPEDKIAYIRAVMWDDVFKGVSELSTVEQIRFVRKAYTVLQGGSPYTYGINESIQDATGKEIGTVFRYKKPLFYHIYEHISTEVFRVNYFVRSASIIMAGRPPLTLGGAFCLEKT